MKLCNVPQDLLAKQAKIDTIPDMIWLVLIATLLTGLYYMYKKLREDDVLDPKDEVATGFVLIGLVVGGTLWASHLLTHIVTAFLNPEYAAMIKFAAECVK
jgi:hypothetical protein